MTTSRVGFLWDSCERRPRARQSSIPRWRAALPTSSSNRTVVLGGRIRTGSGKSNGHAEIAGVKQLRGRSRGGISGCLKCGATCPRRSCGAPPGSAPTTPRISGSGSAPHGSPRCGRARPARRRASRAHPSRCSADCWRHRRAARRSATATAAARWSRWRPTETAATFGSVSPVTRVMDVTCQPPPCPPLNVVNMALSNPGAGRGQARRLKSSPASFRGSPRGQARIDPALWMHVGFPAGPFPPGSRGCG